MFVSAGSGTASLGGVCGIRAIFRGIFWYGLVLATYAGFFGYVVHTCWFILVHWVGLSMNLSGSVYEIYGQSPASRDGFVWAVLQ